MTTETVRETETDRGEGRKGRGRGGENRRQSAVSEKQDAPVVATYEELERRGEERS